MSNVPPLRPPMRGVPAGNGLTCYRDKDRHCGADCMAYEAPPPVADYHDADGTPKQWAHCTLLVNAHRTSKHICILASQGAETLQREKTLAADQKRASQPLRQPCRRIQCHKQVKWTRN